MCTPPTCFHFPSSVSCHTFLRTYSTWMPSHKFKFTHKVNQQLYLVINSQEKKGSIFRLQVNPQRVTCKRMCLRALDPQDQSMFSPGLHIKVEQTHFQVQQPCNLSTNWDIFKRILDRTLEQQGCPRQMRLQEPLKRRLKSRHSLSKVPKQERNNLY